MNVEGKKLSRWFLGKKGERTTTTYVKLCLKFRRCFRLNGKLCCFYLVLIGLALFFASAYSIMAENRCEETDGAPLLKKMLSLNVHAP